MLDHHCEEPGSSELPELSDLPWPPVSWRDRLRTFLRSVIPQNPAQLVFLAGIVCLILASRLNWMPLEAAFERAGSGYLALVQLQSGTRIVLIFSALLCFFSGCAGYFVCFRPGRNPLRGVFVLVFLPAAAAILVDVGRLIYNNSQFTSALDHSLFGNLPSLQLLGAWTSSPGFCFALAGAILTGWFCSRMARGAATLPLTLPGTASEESVGRGEWPRTQLLMWVLVGPLLLAATIPTSAFVFLSFASSRLSSFVNSERFASVGSVVEPLLYLGVIYWIVGRPFDAAVRAALRAFRPIYFLIAAVSPVAIVVVLSTGTFLFDRFIRAEHDFGNMAPPLFASYFSVPDPWLFLMFFAALFEEIVFRGFLRATLVLRYGLYRGVFLTGIVWAAYHFHSDANVHLTLQGMLFQLAFRIGICTTLNFVLCWLTLRSGSVLPAAITHTLYNVLMRGRTGPQFSGELAILVVLWAVLGLFLFKYWPIHEGTLSDETSGALSSEPAALDL